MIFFLSFAFVSQELQACNMEYWNKDLGFHEGRKSANVGDGHEEYVGK